MVDGPWPAVTMTKGCAKIECVAQPSKAPEIGDAGISVKSAPHAKMKRAHPALPARSHHRARSRKLASSAIGRPDRQLRSRHHHARYDSAPGKNLARDSARHQPYHITHLISSSRSAARRNRLWGKPAVGQPECVSHERQSAIQAGVIAQSINHPIRV